jgi:hypothetical protein
MLQTHVDLIHELLQESWSVSFRGQDLCLELIFIEQAKAGCYHVAVSEGGNMV